jgi:hypothetical protein
VQQLTPDIRQLAGVVVTHPVLFRGEIEGVLGVLGYQQWEPRSYLDAQITETSAFLRIRREQPNPPHAKITKYRRGHVVVAGVDWQTQPQIRINGVQSRVLQRVCVQLGVQADTAALMPAQVDDGAAAFARDLLHRSVQLLAAVAPPRSEGVAGKALGVDPNQRDMAVPAVAV